jgi:hypothetical protein
MSSATDTLARATEWWRGQGEDVLATGQAVG